MEARDLYNRYPELWRFLGFFDANLFSNEDLPYDERKVIQCQVSYLRRSTWDWEYFRQVRQEADAILAMEPFPARAVIDTANRWFATPEECKAWFTRVLDAVEQRVEDRRAVAPSTWR